MQLPAEVLVESQGQKACSAKAPGASHQNQPFLERSNPRFKGSKRNSKQINTKLQKKICFEIETSHSKTLTLAAFLPDAQGGLAKFSTDPF